MTALLTKDAILEKLAANKAVLMAFGVLEIGLFGSYVRNQPNLESDIDLLVNIHREKKTFRNYLNLSYFLEGLFNKKVELITKQSLSKHIGPRILETVEYVSITD